MPTGFELGFPGVPSSLPSLSLHERIYVKRSSCGTQTTLAPCIISLHNLLAIPLLQAPFYTSVLPRSENYSMSCLAFYQSLQPTTLMPTTKPPLQRPLPFSLLTGLHAFHGWKKFHYGREETRDHNLSYYSTNYFPILLIRP